MTGGAATEILKKTGLDMAQDVAFNMLSDYADDGKINNGFMDYFKSACMSAGMSGVNTGVINKFKKIKEAGKLSCKAIGRIRTATDIASEVVTDLATTGDCNLTYVENNIDTLTTFSNYKLFFTYKDNKVIQIKDELGRTVQYKYDGDYLTEVVHVDQGITRYTYDEEQNLIKEFDNEGKEILNTYDKLGNLIEKKTKISVGKYCNRQRLCI